MSIWTHITGTVRLDVYSLVSTGDEKGERKRKKDLKELVEMIDWRIKNKNLPQHSEGEVGIQVTPVDEGGNRSEILITIYGDLRDFNRADYPLLKGWFDGISSSDFYKRLLNDVHPSVRQAVLMIEGSDDTHVGDFQVITKKMSDRYN